MDEVHEERSQPLDQEEDNEIRTESAAFVQGEPPQDGNGPPKVDSEVEVLHEKVTKQIIKEGHGQKPSKYATCFYQEEDNEIRTESAAFVQGEPPQDGNGPPKVDSEVEVLHEKVTKQIIKEGHGQKPSKYATCFLHYRAWTESTLHKFEDTWNEQKPVELVLGKEKKEMTGLAIGLSSMKSGERALLHVGWELGYGKEGSFSFPNVPPMADIIYEAELIGFDETKEGKARGDMTVEERIGAADRRKMDGNALFKEEKLEEAMQQYEMAIAYMGDDFMFQLFGKYRDMALAVKNPCHLNMAACMIKLKRYEEAIMQCNVVLAEEENNAKALFRRGKARAELGQTDAAREDYLKVRKFAPEDKAVARELRLLAEHDKALYQKQKEIYKGIFGPRPEPKPKRTNWLVLFWQWLLSLFYRLFKRERYKAD
ncbi:peptidyl-prolyl cis-trans isomerase fkbp42 [Quercus suber]|uniref:peptidylprolyl isomerase n=1 Tax=Quercus suber TaxID=58331 RepID=A0AAW0JI91_QUESU